MNLEIKKRRSSVVMRDGRELSISATPEELAIMKHVFDSFDVEKKGHITVEQITALHMKLGEPLSEAEAKEAFAAMDEEGTGQVRFPQFMKWWQQDHKYDATDKKGKEKGAPSGQPEHVYIEIVSVLRLTI
jgi:Ca2+-binding EF-hand superfamily protein